MNHYNFFSLIISSTLLANLTPSLAKAQQPSCFHNPRQCLSSYSLNTLNPSRITLENNKQYLVAFTSSLNKQVYNYALSKLGQKVGDGECAYLAYYALKSSKAKTLENFGPTGPNADYVWGKLIVSLTPSNRSTSKIMPGDIIQFRNVSTYQKITNPNGSWQSWTANYQHHTAIVAGVSGSTIKLLHQNVGNNPQTKKTVQQGLINLDSLQSGIMWVYRPTR